MEPLPLSSRLCAQCGLAVPPGYLKCPRCHAEQPLQPRRRPVTDGGGTAVQPSGNRTVILLGLAAAALIAIVVWQVLRGGGTTTAAPVPDDDPGSGEDDTTDVAADDAEDPPSDRVPTQPDPPAADPAGAIAALGRALREQRLWASVSASGTTVVVDSSFCEDPGLGSIVDDAAGELRAAAFTTIRCRAPHGEIVFERGL